MNENIAWNLSNNRGKLFSVTYDKESIKPGLFGGKEEKTLLFNTHLMCHKRYVHFLIPLPQNSSEVVL